MGNSTSSDAALALHATGRSLSATYSKDVPSPKLCGTTQFTDKDIASYIEFPQDTFFMEAIAQNAKFDSTNAFVPAQRYVNGRKEVHIYTIRPGMSNAQHFMGPLGAFNKDGWSLTTDVTIYGAVLTSTGILYLTGWNRNSVLAYNVTTSMMEGTIVEPLFEIPDLAAPNDLALDPNDESILYVAGGTPKRFMKCKKGDTKCLQWTNAFCGKIYKVQIENEFTGNHDVQVFSTDHLALAGIEVVDSIVWAAQLYDIFVQEIEIDNDVGHNTDIVWKGRDDSAAILGIVNDDVWLADNVDVYDEEFVLIPAYSVAPNWSVEIGLSNKILASLFGLFTNIFTSINDEDETIREGLRDPEVDLSLSNTYIQEGVPPAPVRLIFMSSTIPSTAKEAQSRGEEDNPCEGVHHFEVDLVETRANNPPREVIDPETGEVLGKRHFFNEQVTHAAHLTSTDGKGFIACINFEQPRVLLLEENAFRPTLGLPVATVRPGP